MANNIHLAGVGKLTKDDYATWKVKMEALLRTKGDLWQYVSGEKLKPEMYEGTNDATRAATEDSIQKWIREDKKARSEIILCINDAEIKQVEHYETSREVWNKLTAIFASKEPTRKSTLVKQLLQRMKEEQDVSEHMKKFTDAVDELKAMDKKINPDVLAIMLSCSLPKSFENFRRTIESRDNLPDMESLKVEILEQNNARKRKSRDDSGTMVASCSKTRNKFMSSPNTQDTTKTNSSIRSTPKRLSDGKPKCYCKVTCENLKCSCRKKNVPCNNCRCDLAKCKNTPKDIRKLKRSLAQMKHMVKSNQQRN